MKITTIRAIMRDVMAPGEPSTTIVTDQSSELNKKYINKGGIIEIVVETTAAEGLTTTTIAAVIIVTTCTAFLDLIPTTTITLSAFLIITILIMKRPMMNPT